MDQTIQSDVFNEADRARYFPRRLEVARCINELQNQELADAAGVVARTVTKWKRGVLPHGSNLRQLAQVTGFPEHYFMKITPSPEINGLNYFVRAGTADYVRDRFTAYGSLVGEILEAILPNLVEMYAQSPRLLAEPKQLLPPERAAVETRRMFGLSTEQTIDSMTALLEGKGVLVVYGLDERRTVDAFSAWIAGWPVAILNPYQTDVLRVRKTLAHELGHLVMHDSVDGKSTAQVQEREREADRFARAFLLPPGADFRLRLQRAVRTYGWAALEGLQASAGISVPEILTFALHGELETERFIAKRAIAWNARDAQDLAEMAIPTFVEQPAALRAAVVAAASAARSTPEALAREVGVPAKYLAAMLR